MAAEGNLFLQLSPALKPAADGRLDSPVTTMADLLPVDLLSVGISKPSEVSLALTLANSLSIGTLKLAESTGYDTHRLSWLHPPAAEDLRVSFLYAQGILSGSPGQDPKMGDSNISASRYLKSNFLFSFLFSFSEP